LPFGVTNPPLDAIFVEFSENLLAGSRQFQAMQTILIGTLEARSIRPNTNRPELNIFPPIQGGAINHGAQQRLLFFGTIGQRLAVIGEGKGNQAPSSDPAMNLARNQSITQWRASWAGSQDDRFIAVSQLKRSEPLGSVEYRSCRASAQEFRPTRVL
jgi:hypothetical protein